MIVGSAEVRINADGTTFGPQLQGILKAQHGIVRQSGQQAGNEYGQGFGQGMGNAVRTAMQNAQRQIGQGLDFNGTFSGPMAADIESGRAEAAMRRTSANLEKEAGQGGQRTARSFSKRYNDILEGDLGKSSIAVANKLQVMYGQMAKQGTIAGVAAGAISALVSGLGLLVGAAGSAASSLAALGPALGAMIQGGAAVSVAFKGVGKAITAGMQAAEAATKKSTAASKDNSRSIIAAQRQVADARQRVADVVVANADRMRNADKQVADAVGGVREAEQNLLQAQRTLTDAQKALTAARKDAREELQQLAFSAEDAALAEQRAGLSLEDAYAKLQAVQNLPPDNKIRREAELSFKEAELNYREAKDRAQDLGKEQAEAAKKGIKGTKAYQSAQKDVVGAQKGVADAQKGLGDAEVKLADARAARSKAAATNARDLSKAQLALKRALEDLNAAQKKNADTADAASKAMDKYKEALDKLAPSARDFVKYLVTNKDKFNSLKKDVQAPFFDKLYPAFKKFAEGPLPDLAKKLGVTSGIMGTFAAQFLSMKNISRFGPIMDQNNKFLSLFSERGKDGKSALDDLVTIFGQAYKAISPLTNRFGKFLVAVLNSKAAFLDSKGGLASLTSFFDRAGNRMAKFWDIFKNIVGIFKTVFKAARKPIDDFLGYFQTAFQKLNDKAAANAGAITKHFEGVEKNLEPMLDLVGKIALMFLKMGSDPKLGETFKTLQDALPYLQQMLNAASDAGPIFAKLVVKVAKLIATFADDGSLKTFFGTLLLAADFLSKALDNKVVQNVLKIVGPILGAVHAVALLRKGFEFVGKAILGMFLKDTKMFLKGKNDGDQYLKGWEISGAATPPVNPGGAGGGGKSGGPAAADVPKGGKTAGGTPVFVDGPEPAPGKKGKAAKAGKAAGAAGAGSGLAPVIDNFSGNLKLLATQFGLTGKAKDIFIGNLKLLRDQFLIPLKAPKAAALAPARPGAPGAVVPGRTPVIIPPRGRPAPMPPPTRPVVLPPRSPAASAPARTNVAPMAAGAAAGPAKAAAGAGKMGGALKSAGMFAGRLVSVLGTLAMVAMVLVPIFTSLYQNNDKFKKTVDGLLAVLSDLFKTLMTALAPALKIISDTFKNLIKQVGPALTTLISTVVGALAPVISTIVKAFGSLMSAIAPVINMLVKTLVPVFGKIIGVIVTTVIPVIGQLITTFASALMPIIQQVAGVVVQLVKAFAGAFQDILKAVLPIITNLIDVFVKQLLPAIMGLLPVVMQVFKAIIGVVVQLIPVILPIITQIIDIFIKTLVPIIQELAPLFTQVVTMITDAVNQILPVLLPVITQIVDLFIKVLLPAVMEIVPQFLNLFGEIIKAVGGLVAALLPVILQLVGLFVKTLLPAILGLLPIFIKVFMAIIGIVLQLIPVLLPIIMQLVDLFVTTLIPVILQLMPVFTTVITSILDIVVQLLPVLMPIVLTLVDLLIKILIPAVQLVADIIGIVFKIIVIIIQAAVTVLSVVLKILVWVITKILIPAIQLIVTVVTAMAKFFIAAIKAAFNFFNSVWNNVLKPAIQAVKDAIGRIKVTAEGMRDGFTRAIKAAFKFFLDMYNQYVKPTFDALKRGFEKMATWAENAKKAVSEGFKGLVNGIKKPVIEALKWINDHLIDPINSVTSKFGLNIPKIPIPAKAEGGPVVGPGGPTQDNLPHMLSNGEYVIKARSARRIGMQNLTRMNETGNIPPGAGTGGIGSWIKEKAATLKKVVTDPASVIEAGVAKTLSAIYDNLMKPGIDFLKKDTNFVSQFIAAILEKMKEGMADFGKTQDTKLAAQAAAANYGGGSTGGKSGARGVWNALRSGGLSEKQAAGVMGNIEAESGFKWNIHERSGGGGYGLVQWTPHSKLTAILKAGHKSDSLGNQIWALFHQLSGKGPYSEGPAGKALKAATSVLAATRAFMLKYERPANQSSANVSSRNVRSEKWYKNFHGSKVGGGGDDYAGSTGGGWVYPLSRHFGITQYPNRGHRPSWSVDIGAGSGTGVRAASAGKVKSVTNLGNRSYGKYIVLSHGNGVTTLYAHLKSFKVKSGQNVRKGQTIALSDSTGHSSGNHLHFELRPSSNTITAMKKRGVKLATGGVVQATSGGVAALLGEAGKNERVEPLDREGLSVRDRALIQSIVAQMAGKQPAGGSGTVVRVYIGNEELKDIVRYEISDGQSTLAKALSTGRRAP